MSTCDNKIKYNCSFGCTKETSGFNGMRKTIKNSFLLHLKKTKAFEIKKSENAFFYLCGDKANWIKDKIRSS